MSSSVHEVFTFVLVFFGFVSKLLRTVACRVPVPPGGHVDVLSAAAPEAVCSPPPRLPAPTVSATPHSATLVPPRLPVPLRPPVSVTPPRVCWPHTAAPTVRPHWGASCVSPVLFVLSCRQAGGAASRAAGDLVLLREDHSVRAHRCFAGRRGCGVEDTPLGPPRVEEGTPRCCVARLPVPVCSQEAS